MSDSDMTIRENITVLFIFRFSIPDPNPKVRPYVYHYNPCKAFIMTIPGCQNPDMTVRLFVLYIELK